MKNNGLARTTVSDTELSQSVRGSRIVCEIYCIIRRYVLKIGLRRDAREAEGARLEIVYSANNGIEGSTPSLSAMHHVRCMACPKPKHGLGRQCLQVGFNLVDSRVLRNKW